VSSVARVLGTIVLSNRKWRVHGRTRTATRVGEV
jgi:hypothetical protein